jgi:glycosyltransferase involved in cell wall biosynthesis
MSQSLAISGHFRRNQLVGGVASVFNNLSRGIEAVIDRDERFRDLRVTVFHGPDGVPYHSERFEYREQSNRWGRFAADLRYGLVDSGEFDASLFPNYFRPPIVRSRRSIAVIHDLIRKHMPEMMRWRKRKWLDAVQRLALRQCDAVVTISETVKQDVLRWFGQRWADKITPIWNPIAFARLEGDQPPTSNEGRPYLLGVAVDRPFKNLHTLIRSFAKLRPEFPDHCLVLAGELRSRRAKGDQHGASVNAKMPATVDLVRDLGLAEHVKVTGFVSDAELGALYRGADAFVLPSLFEGFGMPAAESLAMGTPTIVSGIPALREATLGAAYYLSEPQNVDRVADEIAAVLRLGPAARPAPALVTDIRHKFHPATIATRYLEVIFEQQPVAA